MKEENMVLYDRLNGIKVNGEFSGSIISRSKEENNPIIFSDNLQINGNKISISEGLMVGFEIINGKKTAFSKRLAFNWNLNETSMLEYCVKIPKDIMDQYDEGQFSDAFPFTLNLLHTAGLLLKDPNNKYSINHLDFFFGEILKNPVALINNGMCVADRVVIDHRGDPVFYDCLIVGRDSEDALSVTYEPLANVDDDVIKYIIILGIEELKL